MGFALARIAVTTTLILMAAPSAQALNLKSYLLKQDQKGQNLERDEAGACANFRGRWVGQCQDHLGGTFSDTLNIDQTGCNHFRIHHEEQGTVENYEIGEAKRVGAVSTTTGWNSDIQEYVMWSQDFTILINQISKTANQIRTQDFWKDQGSQRFAFRAGQLMMTLALDGDGYEGGKAVTRKTSLVCRYDKG